jgi:hypothetical protein
MPVRYIRVQPIADLFAPAVRAYGNIAMIGAVTVPATPPADLLAVNESAEFTDPAEARRRAPGPLGESIALAFAQSPGPTVIFGVRVDSTTPDWNAAFDLVATLEAQLVTVAETPLDATTGAADGPIGKLAAHVIGVSNTGPDGMERMGVAMLDKGVTDPAMVTGALATERMIYIAHKSDADVAAAVAGTIAGYEPQISLLLKQVAITSAPFTAAEIDQINGPEEFGFGPAGKGVNWLVDPPLIPGSGTYLGEGYTGNPGGKKYIDIVRTMDDISFRLKSQMISLIGNLRISRSGLRGMVAQLQAVLDPLVNAEMIDGYELVVPTLILLDKQPETLTESQQKQIQDVQNQRFVEVLIAVDYAGAIHRLDITLKFQ